MLVLIKTAVILAGGVGLRLRPLTDDSPKAMVLVAGKPLLQWTVEWLRESGIPNIVIGVAYRRQSITDYFQDGRSFGVNVRYSVHSVEGGTAEGFKLAIQRHVRDEQFLAMNGDEIVNIDLKAFAKYHSENGGVVTVAVGPLRSPFGVVELEGTDIVGFQEKPVLKSHLVSMGTYIFSQEILKFLPDKGDVERTAFPKLASMRKLKAYVHQGFWATVNTMKDLQDLEDQLNWRCT